MNGFFNIDKPQGLTSHDVVARVRRMTRARQCKVGHAGTLDPLATGVLPIAVGAATRLLEYLSAADKAYRARIVFGATSDTYDREGVITPSGAPLPTLAQVEEALQSFKGDIEQLPPMHSAIKLKGKKLYELARAGLEVEREPRRVTINRLVVEDYTPPTLDIFIECSKGTYIRSLAHDLGRQLSPGAYLDALTRTRHGPFELQDSVSLETLLNAFQHGTWQKYMYAPLYILPDWPRHETTRQQAEDLAQGRPLRLPPPQDRQSAMAATSPEGALLAILYWNNETSYWQPIKVFSQG